MVEELCWSVYPRIRRGHWFSSSSLAKLDKDENVTTDVLLRICNSLDVELNDIAEAMPDEETPAEIRRDAGRSMTRSHRSSMTGRAD